MTSKFVSNDAFFFSFRLRLYFLLKLPVVADFYNKSTLNFWSWVPISQTPKQPQQGCLVSEKRVGKRVFTIVELLFPISITISLSIHMCVHVCTCVCLSESVSLCVFWFQMCVYDYRIRFWPDDRIDDKLSRITIVSALMLS